VTLAEARDKGASFQWRAANAAGKDVTLSIAPEYNNFEMGESFGNLYGPFRRAALKLMKPPIQG